MGQAHASFSKCPSAFGITGLRLFHFFSECLLHFIMSILSSAQSNCGSVSKLMYVLICKSLSSSVLLDFPYDDAPTDVQMELVELQASDVISSKFSTCTTLIDFYRQLPRSQFPLLLVRAKRVIAMFRQHLFVRGALFEDEIL